MREILFLCFAFTLVLKLGVVNMNRYLRVYLCKCHTHSEL